MQTFDLWHQLNLYWRKIVLLIGFGFVFLAQAEAQNRYKPISLSGDDNQFISYGFFLAAHTSTLRLKYSNAFMDPTNPTYAHIQSIQPVFSPGFSLGFLIKMRLHDQVTLLATPKVGFYEYRTDLTYFPIENELINIGNLVNGPYSKSLITETTMVELPLLIKYKSIRFDNTRMFFVGGANPMFRTKSQDEADSDELVLNSTDIALELGMGFDFYFKFFKFSPELRFSHGMVNIYREEASDPNFAGAIEELRRKNITLYLNFQ